MWEQIFGNQCPDPWWKTWQRDGDCMVPQTTVPFESAAGMRNTVSHGEMCTCTWACTQLTCYCGLSCSVRAGRWARNMVDRGYLEWQPVVTGKRSKSTIRFRTRPLWAINQSNFQACGLRLCPFLDCLQISLMAAGCSWNFLFGWKYDSRVSEKKLHIFLCKVILQQSRSSVVTHHKEAPTTPADLFNNFIDCKKVSERVWHVADPQKL